MKIALLLFGRIDKFEQHDALFQSIGEEHSVDVFLSSDNPCPDHLQRFKELYKPVAYEVRKIEHSINPYKYPLRECGHPDNVVRHFINKKRVFSLCESYMITNNVSYDVFLATRVDLTFDHRIPLREVAIDTLYVPDIHDFGGLNDRLAFGDFESIKKYMNIFDRMIPILDGGIVFHPETLTMANVKLHNLNLVRFPYVTVIVR